MPRKLKKMPQKTEGTPSRFGYKNKWKPYDFNIKFWVEVLVGKKIDSLLFDKVGLHALVLDDGQTLFIDPDSKRRVFVKD